jgi:hypothetical protein
MLPSQYRSRERVKSAMHSAFANLKRLSRRLGKLLLGPLVLIIILSFAGCFPDSTVNCWQSEIDILTGRIRYSYFLLCVPLYRSVRDSALTRVLSEEERKSPARLWHTVTRISPGKNYSPHYFYHGAIHQASQLEDIWNTQGLATPARRESARRVLKAWQQDGHYSGVQKYIYSLKGLEENEVTGMWEAKARRENGGIANKPMDSGVATKKAPNQ